MRRVNDMPIPKIFLLWVRFLLVGQHQSLDSRRDEIDFSGETGWKNKLEKYTR